jgi:hypothetical protein
LSFLGLAHAGSIALQNISVCVAVYADLPRFLRARFRSRALLSQLKPQEAFAHDVAYTDGRLKRRACRICNPSLAGYF